jgi:hypothetical protein
MIANQPVAGSFGWIAGDSAAAMKDCLPLANGKARGIPVQSNRPLQKGFAMRDKPYPACAPGLGGICTICGHGPCTKTDLANDVILPAIGAAALFAAWYYDYLPWKVIKAILTEAV